MAQHAHIIIEYQCPQCGAPAILEETDRLFLCAYCRVASVLSGGDFFRFRLPPHASLEKTDLLYLPYWRFKGCLFSVLPGTVRHRIVDISSRAADARGVPPSLGLRTQTLKMTFLGPDAGGRLAAVTIPFKTVIDQTRRRFSALLAKPLYRQNFIGETMSLIYAPYYHDGTTPVDAVLSQAAILPAGAFVDHPPCETSPVNGNIECIPALCPACGWDLNGRSDSIAFECANCNTFWIQAGRGFESMAFGSIPSASEGALSLPFYRIEADISGIDLASRADLIRFANLPRVAGTICESRPLYFWTPAFKISPGELLRAARHMTVAQPDFEWREEVPPREHHPVTLPMSEAAELAEIVLASLAKPPFAMNRISDMSLRPRNCFLAYLPFETRGSELYQPRIKLRLSRNLLTYGAYL